MTAPMILPMTRRPNVLLITLDQYRGDALGCAGHPIVRTPNLDALAADGVRFANHFSQAAPCSPGRAALYTGTYQMTNRVVANGTPLDERFDNVARAARRAGYRPDAVRLHRPGRRPPDGHRSGRPATVGLRRRAPRLRRRGVPPDRRRAVDAMAGRAGPRPARLRAARCAPSPAVRPSSRSRRS